MIIAEASLQHEGRASGAEYDAAHAKDAGADAIKFQLFVPDEPLFCPLEGDEVRWPKWMASCLPQHEWQRVKDYCAEIGIDFMASVFQHSAVELYKSLNPQWWKVASRAAQSFPYEKGQKYIVSTGMPPNDRAIECDSIFLDCKMQYPHDPYYCELRWEDGFEISGLSDHSGSPWPAIQLLALEESAVIEVHVDFGREKELPEEISLDQLKLICEARDAFAAMRQS